MGRGEVDFLRRRSVVDFDVGVEREQNRLAKREIERERREEHKHAAWMKKLSDQAETSRSETRRFRKPPSFDHRRGFSTVATSRFLAAAL